MVAQWAIVYANLSVELPLKFREVLGAADGQKAWDEARTKFDTDLAPVRKKYATLVGIQAAFRKLKQGETRAGIVQTALKAAEDLAVALPPKLAMVMKSMADAK